MQYCFTPAAKRALTDAYGWSGSTGYDDLKAEALLLGLLAEPECRAAALLAKQAIDVPAVRQRWPQLANNGTTHQAGGKLFSKEIELSLQAICERLAGFPHPLELATEHLLLGLAAADHEVSAWLRQQGVDPDALDADIHRWYGVEMEPIAWDAGLGTSVPSSGQKTEVRDRIPKIETACGFALSPLPSPLSPTPVLRVLDAAANRAGEGLRVVEDYVRFVLDDRHLTGLCKQLRHDLTEIVNRVSPRHRLAARETQADVGTGLSTAAEQRRGELSDVLAANFARLQESLRSLEEFGKIDSSRHTSCAEADGTQSVPATFKQLRYRAYTLQRAVDITRDSIERLAAARLYVLIDGRRSAEEFQRLATSLIEAGVHVLQLRDKQLDDRKLLQRARLLRDLCRGTKTLVVINDRPDLAALAKADGVHLGQEEVAVKDARSIVGPEALVGVSTHSIEQARQAVLDGANYIGVGPTFPSDTKRFSHYPGVELLRAVAAEIRLPAFAIGGIGPNNLGEVLAAGVARIAVGSAIAASNDPAAAARELLAALGSTSAG